MFQELNAGKELKKQQRERIMLLVPRGCGEPIVIVLERIVNAFVNNNEINGYDNNTLPRSPSACFHNCGLVCDSCMANIEETVTRVFC